MDPQICDVKKEIRQHERSRWFRFDSWRRFFEEICLSDRKGSSAEIGVGAQGSTQPGV